MNHPDLTIIDVEPDEGEVLRLAVIRADGRDVAGLTVRGDGTAQLWTWPDGEQNERADLPTGVTMSATNPTHKTPYQFGYEDGLASPDDLSMGRTWREDDPFFGDPSQDPNEEYDRGVNAGQAAAASRGRTLPDLIELAHRTIAGHSAWNEWLENYYDPAKSALIDLLNRNALEAYGITYQFGVTTNEEGERFVKPATCILTGAEGENPDDCTTHEHEDQDAVETCPNCGALYGEMGHDPEPCETPEKGSREEES